LLELNDAPWLGGTQTGIRIPAGGIQLLAPCLPRQIFAVGLNYKSHLGERKAPKDPEIFYKPVSSLLDPEGDIRIPAEAVDAHFEGELVAVMGKALKRATHAEAADAVFGLTCGNDVSDRNWQRGPDKDLQWWRAKGSDTFAPLGPAIVTGLDPADRHLTTRVNGETLQNQSTSDLLFNVPAIASWISQWVTIQPGDLIYTGTPGNTRRLQPGDVVEVEIDGIGVLRNSVKAESR
jgi:2-keto-4-pentenoate hydratase/2-oxohepta-3-ene-1,7-dioic acid hydratase in catechol pathway